MSELNISSSNIFGKCNLKCIYNFNYPKTQVTGINSGQLIELKFDITNEPPVTYNNNKYNATSGIIVSPSLHKFNGYLTEAEIIIIHTSLITGRVLNVCIPFILSKETTNASNYITDIIEKISSNAPNLYSSTVINNSDFTLQNIIPKKPFYTYTSNEGVWKGADFVLFDKQNAIPITSLTLNTLNKIIKPFKDRNMVLGNADTLFHNNAGPNSTTTADGIYIKCNPTGTSEANTEVEYEKDEVSTGFFGMSGSGDYRTLQTIALTFLLFIIIILFFLFVFEGVNLTSKLYDGSLKNSADVKAYLKSFFY